MGKAIMATVEKCLACRSCELACAVAHSKTGVVEKAITETPKPQKRVTVEAAGQHAVPIQCRHCEDAPCIAVCPTAAIHRPDEDKTGPVLIDQEKCIGCKYCLMVCPFGVIDVSNDGKVMVKCDLCFERAKMGEEPACVEACPTKALLLVDEKDLISARRQQAARELVLSSQQNKKRKSKKLSQKRKKK